VYGARCAINWNKSYLYSSRRQKNVPLRNMEQIWAQSNWRVIRSSGQRPPFTWIHIRFPESQTNGQLSNMLIKKYFTV
jgi:hypothetical protein